MSTISAQVIGALVPILQGSYPDLIPLIPKLVDANIWKDVGEDVDGVWKDVMKVGLEGCWQGCGLWGMVTLTPFSSLRTFSRRFFKKS